MTTAVSMFRENIVKYGCRQSRGMSCGSLAEGGGGGGVEVVKRYPKHKKIRIRMDQTRDN